MSGQGDAHANEESQDKKSDASVKVDVLGKWDNGMSTAAIRCHYGVNKIICFITKLKTKSWKVSSPVNCKNYLCMLS